MSTPAWSISVVGVGKALHTEWECKRVTMWLCGFCFVLHFFPNARGKKSIYNSILWLLPLHFLLIVHLNSMNCPVRVDTHNKWPQIWLEMEARASDQTLGNHNYPKSRTAFAGKAFISVWRPSCTSPALEEKGFIKHISPLPWQEETLLFAKRLHVPVHPSP